MKLVIFMVFLTLGACSSVRTEQVEFSRTSAPKESFRELRKLGVVEVKGLPPFGNTYLQKKLKRCSGLGRTRPVKRHFKIDYTNPQTIAASYERAIKNYPNSNKSHGFLSMEIVKKELKGEKQTFTVASYDDTSKHGAFFEAGSFTNNNFGLAAPLTFAPIPDIKKADGKGTSIHYDLELRYSVYNSVLKKLVTFDSVRGQASLTNTSSQPRIGSAWVFHRLIMGLIDKIAHRICYLGPTVERTLYSPNNESYVAKKINAGVDQAVDGRWEAATKTWNNAIQKQRKNSLAHHNLGVAYEYQGELEKAYEHYYLARKGRYSKEIEVSRYDRLLRAHSRKYALNKTRPIIYAVDSGYWLRITKPKNFKFKVGKTYSVYRQQVAEGEGGVKTIKILEIGSIVVEENYSGFVLARLKTQILEHNGINVGDMLVL